MKKLLIIASLFLTISVNAQKVQKPTQKTDSTLFYLVGKLADWQLLYKAVTEPGKITRDEIVELIIWINRLQPIPTDTTKKK